MDFIGTSIRTLYRFDYYIEMLFMVGEGIFNNIRNLQACES